MPESEAPAPAAPATASAGSAAGGNTGAVVTLEQLAAIVAALSGSVSTLTSQVQASQAFQTQIAPTIDDARTAFTQAALNFVMG